MAILNVRGTGGSGKSTLVRGITACYPQVTPCFVDSRKTPIGYLCERPMGASLFVVGSYERPCGGGDTLPTPGAVFDLVEEQAGLARDVIFEGIIAQDNTTRTMILHERFRLVVIGLLIPIETCLTSIRDRRQARGDAKPLNPKNTIARARSVERSLTKLAASGVDVRTFDDRALAFEAACAVLDVTPIEKLIVERPADPPVERTPVETLFDLLP